MLHKKHKPASLDGFIPSSQTNPNIGFERPRRDAGQFPGVGVTLSAYSPNNPTMPQPQASAINDTATMQTVYHNPYELPDVPAAPEKRAVKPRRRRPWKRFVALFFILLILIPAGWLAYKFLYNTAKVLHGNPLGILGISKLQGEDVGRVNILLAGNSSDDPGHDGADLTDSIMVVSIDTKNNSAFMLSVPRDLWVNIPGYGHAKINEAYVDGEQGKFSQSGYFPGGMGLLQKVIEQNLNINLNYYALINYNAFRDMVNAVGGISVNVQSSDKRGLYDPSIDWSTHGPLVRLTNGVHTLNGEQALDLARARGDAYGSYGFPGSDFDRTAHQRQMLLALRDKATSSGVIANPVKISSLLDAVGNNIKTDFTAGEVHRLYDITKTIPQAGIQSVSLNSANGKNLLASYTSYAGQSALIPAAGLDNFSDIQAFLKKMVSSDPVAREGATVIVLNATDTAGLAAKTAQTLKDKGITVSGVGDATTTQATSSLVDLSNGSSPATKQYLTKIYGATVTTTNPRPGVYDADYIVIVGADKVPAATATDTNP